MRVWSVMAACFAVSFAVSFAVCASSLAAQVANAQDAAEPVSVQVPLTDEMKARGVHGTVLLNAAIGEDGRIETLELAESSGSEELDAYAIERLGNAPVGAELLEDGNRSLVLEIDMYAYRLGTDFGSTYLCGQSVRDHAWFQNQQPGGGIEKGKLYHFIGGLALLSQRDEIRPLLNPERRELAWNIALEACNAYPEERFLAVLIRAGQELERSNSEVVGDEDNE